MDVTQAKGVVDMLSTTWNIPNADFVAGLFGELWMPSVRGNVVQAFEFSFLEDTEMIRVNHLYFADMGEKHSDAVRRERKEKIISVVRTVGQKYSMKFDECSFGNVLAFSDSDDRFPLQFGLEYGRNERLRIKLYFSIDGLSFPSQSFCDTIGLGYGESVEAYAENGFDTVAVDFLPDGKTRLKVYPLSSRHSGTLLRFSESGVVVSKKVWQRIPEGVNARQFLESGFLSVPDILGKYMVENRLRISYLCEERGKRSVYFR